MTIWRDRVVIIGNVRKCTGSETVAVTDEPPEPGLGEAVEAARGAPETPGWDG